jgi:hypothetical protein
MPSFQPVLPLPFAATPVASSVAPAPHHHLVLPYAAVQDSSCQHLLRDLHLPHLDQLLRALSPAAVDEGDVDDRVPPHERAVAAAWRLAPQQPAWAALAQGISDTPCAWLTPCHWTAGPDQVRMDDPAAVVLDLADAQALHALLQPWFAEDGMQLEIIEPQRWCVRGAPLAQLQTASLDRVLLRDVTPWMPSAATARQLHRLHSEVQMLLYNAPWSDDRAARGLAPINAFWLHGAGQLTAPELQTARACQAQTQLHVVDALRQAALYQDWPAWKAAWLAADAGPVAQLLQHVQAGGNATLWLCGEQHARSLTAAPRNWLSKLKNTFSPQRFADLHTAL